MFRIFSQRQAEAAQSFTSNSGSAEARGSYNIDALLQKLSSSVRARILKFQSFMESARSNGEDAPPYLHILKSVPARELASAFCLPEVIIVDETLVSRSYFAPQVIKPSVEELMRILTRSCIYLFASNYMHAPDATTTHTHRYTCTRLYQT